MSVEIWSEKYRPQTLDEYVWRDQTMRQKFEEWLRDGSIPHLLLSGKSGLGKTSLAKLILKLLGVPSGDILEIPASRHRGIEEIQERIMGFVQSYPMIDNPTATKFVILDEADSLSLHSQKFLRSEFDIYQATTRFILTCNHVNKIMPAVAGRCQQFHFEALDQEDFVLRLTDILGKEQVEYELDDLVEYINQSYPDLRKCIGLVQKSVIRGKLHPVVTADTKVDDYLITAIEMFRDHRHLDARKLIVENASIEEYPDIFRFLYQNIELWGDSQDEQDDALIIIRDGIFKSNFVSDQEINMSATIAELVRLTRKSHE